MEQAAAVLTQVDQNLHATHACQLNKLNLRTRCGVHLSEKHFNLGRTAAPRVLSTPHSCSTPGMHRRIAAEGFVWSGVRLAQGWVVARETPQAGTTSQQ